MKESDILRELTALDKTTLEGGDDYLAYFTYLQSLFNRLLESLRARTQDDPLEISILQRFAGQFLNTVECLRMKYLCEPERKLRYDPTDSSFPSFIEFKELEYDLTMRDQKLRELPSVDVLKQAILDSLFRNQVTPDALLQQLGQREYNLLLSRYSTLGGLFREFTPGDWKPLAISEKTGAAQFLYSWGSFDVLTNRPHIYMLILEQNPDPKAAVKAKQELLTLEETVKKISNNTAPLQVIARDLDAAFKEFSPKVLKRIELGPIYGRYSSDEHFYSLILDKNFGPDDLIFRFTTEIIFSIGETKTKGLLSGGELRQIFFVDKSNRETIERNVSEVHQYMIANHAVVQYLNDHYPEKVRELALPPIAFTPPKQGSDAEK